VIVSHLSVGLGCAGGVAVIETIKPSWIGIQGIINDIKKRGGTMADFFCADYKEE